MSTIFLSLISFIFRLCADKLCVGEVKTLSDWAIVHFCYVFFFFISVAGRWRFIAWIRRNGGGAVC
jgi:hypothetical protein